MGEDGGRGGETGKTGAEDTALPTDPRDARRNTAPLRLSFVPQNSLGANGKSPGTANNFPNTLTGL